MKKIVLMTLVLLGSIGLKAQVFGEFFMNPNNSEFEMVSNVANSNSDMVWVMHFEPKSQVGDSLYLIESSTRRRILGSNVIPCGFINGDKVYDLTDTTNYWIPIINSINIDIEGSIIINPQLQLELNWNITASGGQKIMGFLVEDVYNYNNVVRKIFSEADATTEWNPMAMFNPIWNEKDMSLVVIVTDMWGDVVGVKEMPLKESVTTSINSIVAENTLKLYPNPVNDYFNIENLNNVIEQVVIYNIEGKQMYSNNITQIDDYCMKINTTEFKNGLYMVLINNQIKKKIIVNHN